MATVASHALIRRELAIETADLVKMYGRTRRALDGLSFTVRTGTNFGLLGPNGAVGL